MENVHDIIAQKEVDEQIQCDKRSRRVGQNAGI